MADLSLALHQNINTTVDWQRFLFDPQQHWIARFEKLARRRLLDPNLADQAVEQALAKLQENEWARLKQFQGLSSPDAFLLCVYRHLLEDFAVARFGKCRAPVWIVQMGLRWETLYKRLCCERHSVESVTARYASSNDDEKAVRDICRVIKAKIPQCGNKVQFQSLTVDDEESALDVAAPEYSGPAQQLQQRLCDDVLSALTQLLRGESTTASKINAELMADLLIDNDTRLLLRMIYQDEISLPRAAAIVGVAEHNARRQIKRAMAQIAERLQKAGFDWSDWSGQHD